MRLKDADELLARADCSLELISEDGTSYIPCIDYVDEICNAPTVEAIPVEWLENYINRVLYKLWFGLYDRDYYLDEVRKMITEWKKENEG